MSIQTLTAPSDVGPPGSAHDGGSPACAHLGAPATTKYDVSARRIELWSPWGGTGRPSTAADEARLIAHLRALSEDRHEPYERQHVTSLVTALRNGLTGEQMLSLAPGLRPAALVAAYDDLDRRRRVAAAAWHAIVATPDFATLSTEGPVAAALMPVIIIHLESLRLRRRTDGPQLRAAIVGIDEEITRTVQSTEMLEERLDSGTLNPTQQAQVGEILYDGFGEGAWSLSTFLSPRVGTLVPARVAALLGEERSNRSRVAS